MSVRWRKSFPNHQILSQDGRAVRAADMSVFENNPGMALNGIQG